jgi:hypothetical protein
MNRRIKQVEGRKLCEGDMILIRRYPQRGDDWDIIMKIGPYRPQDDNSMQTGVRIAHFDRSRGSQIMIYPDAWFWVFTNKKTDELMVNKLGRAKRAFDFDTP